VCVFKKDERERARNRKIMQSKQNVSLKDEK